MWLVWYCLSKNEIEIKTQRLQSPWITRGLQTSSKWKQRLHEKFLKKRTSENETIYKKYKYLFEKIKKKSKTSYYQRKLKLFEGDIKKEWKIIKEVIEKKRGTCDSFPKTLIIDKVEITNTKATANSFNNFFVKIRPNLASKTPKSDTNFEAYISKANTKLNENPLTEDELLKAFNSFMTEAVII